MGAIRKGWCDLVKPEGQDPPSCLANRSQFFFSFYPQKEREKKWRPSIIFYALFADALLIRGFFLVSYLYARNMSVCSIEISLLFREKRMNVAFPHKDKDLVSDEERKVMSPFIRQLPFFWKICLGKGREVVGATYGQYFSSSATEQ